MDEMFEIIFGIVTTLLGLFPVLIWLFIIIFAVKASNTNKNNTTSSTTGSNNSRDYGGITRAGSHYHKGSVGTTRKDEEWEETRCGKYKDEIFGKDTCNTYTKPDYDSLTCEDEDLSGG